MTAEAEAGGPARSRRRPRSRGWGRGRRDRPSRRTCLVSGRTPREPPRPVPRRTRTSRAPSRVARAEPSSAPSARAAPVNRDDGSDEISDEDASSEPPTMLPFARSPPHVSRLRKLPKALPRRAGRARRRKRRRFPRERPSRRDSARFSPSSAASEAPPRAGRAARAAGRKPPRRNGGFLGSSRGCDTRTPRDVQDAFVRYATRSRLLTFLDYASRDLVLQGVDSSPRFASHRRATGATGTATAGPVPAPLGNTGCLFAHCMELLCTP